MIATNRLLSVPTYRNGRVGPAATRAQIGQQCDLRHGRLIRQKGFQISRENVRVHFRGIVQVQIHPHGQNVKDVVALVIGPLQVVNDLLFGQSDGLRLVLAHIGGRGQVHEGLLNGQVPPFRVVRHGRQLVPILPFQIVHNEMEAFAAAVDIVKALDGGRAGHWKLLEQVVQGGFLSGKKRPFCIGLGNGYLL
jgi:hypothetical protein